MLSDHAQLQEMLSILIYRTLPGDRKVPKAAGGTSDERPLKKTRII